ncbi:MAG: tetratricopeptide repeat protein [Verrucomicrobia bacterium]|jgi:tetratricopeptide (TPR) repeat protein|nr:tetratricopeptide repeat protein [Verrucomicrobiota bacterium]
MKSIFFHPSTLALAVGLALAPAGLQADDNTTNTVAGEAVPSPQQIPPEVVRSFLYLQEQMHATQLAVERSRLDSEAAAARSSEALNARLRVIEEALLQANTQGRTAVADASRQISESNYRVMILAGIIASLGFLALATTAWMQWRVASQLSAQGTAVGSPALLPAAGYSPMGFRAANGQSANVRLMHTLGRLEHRIAELELGHHAAMPPANVPSVQVANPPIPAASTKDAGSNEPLAALIKQGEDLLTQEEAEQAVAHFDALLAKHPGHPEVLLHKGAALERLERDEEALECYDQALRADHNHTMAYLHKGGLYNRMERFTEAMECYEKALKVQEGRTAA